MKVQYGTQSLQMIDGVLARFVNTVTFLHVPINLIQVLYVCPKKLSGSVSMNNNEFQAHYKSINLKMQ